jgi:hypothetical protein
MCYERRRAEACVDESAHHAPLGGKVCVFITAGPSTKLFTWGGGGIWEDMSSIYWTVYKFFASQSLHNIKILKKKIRRSKRQRNFSLFYFASQES